MNHLQIQYHIQETCWKTFLGHGQINLTQPMINHKEKSLSWADGKPVNLTEAKDNLLRWINQSLKKHKKVILYTCPDNALISIEDPSKVTDKELSYCEEQIPNIFYIAHD